MFNANAVGAGLARKKYEELLHKDLKKKFEVIDSKTVLIGHKYSSQFSHNLLLASVILI